VLGVAAFNRQRGSAGDNQDVKMINRTTTRARLMNRTHAELVEKCMDLADEVLRLRAELKRKRPTRTEPLPPFLADLFK